MSNRQRTKDPRPWRVGKSEKNGTNRFLRRQAVEENEVTPHKKKAPSKPRKYRGCGNKKNKQHVERVRNVSRYNLFDEWQLVCTECGKVLDSWYPRYWGFIHDNRKRPAWLPDHVPGGRRD